MKNLLIAAAVVVVGAATAQAADLPAKMYTKAPAKIADPVYNWSGFYAGVNAGGVFGGGNSVDIATFTNTPGFGLPFTQAAGRIPRGVSVSRDGFIGGGQIGYNWQLRNFVLGFEADIDGLTRSNRTSTTAVPFAAGGGGLTGVDTTIVNKSNDYIGTVRGRLGILAAPSFLVYATGGLAYGDVKVNSSITDVVGAGAPTVATSSFSQTREGYTVGAGVEWMFAPSWSVKGEYLYYDLGRVTSASTIFAPTAPFLTTSYALSTRNDGNIARVGINYHFN
jgi:outer membrane immunogenic protein